MILKTTLLFNTKLKGWFGTVQACQGHRWILNLGRAQNSENSHAKAIPVSQLQLVFDRGCVKTREKSSSKKIDLSEQPLRDFFEAGGVNPLMKTASFLRFYTAWTHSGILTKVVIFLFIS